MALLQRVIDEFRALIGGEPAHVVRAPGRVNLIGEHTDYNDGFVLPMAIEPAIYIALRPREDNVLHVHSLDFDGAAQFSLDGIEHGGPEWAEYLKGQAWAMQQAGMTLKGWDGVIAGDVPGGAGLSSSAALEMATARAFAAMSGIPWDSAQMAQLGQKNENQWVGAKTGIMDQMISAAGVAGHALLIDCRWLTFEAVPLPSGTSVVILDTATRRGLVGTAYNERREQCEAGAKFFGVPALRDVSSRQLRGVADLLDPLVLKRARHIVTENERTLAAANAMRKGDAAEMGRLMDASHVSMRDDFEISRDEMNTMVVLAQKHEASYGARMTGGGFGGCAVALVKAEMAQQFADEVGARYQELTTLTPAIYVTGATDGANVLQ